MRSPPSILVGSLINPVSAKQQPVGISSRALIGTYLMSSGDTGDTLLLSSTIASISIIEDKIDEAATRLHPEHPYFVIQRCPPLATQRFLLVILSASEESPLSSSEILRFAQHNNLSEL